MIKVKKRKILLLPGDGVGPEVIAEVKKIIEWNYQIKYKKCLDVCQQQINEFLNS